MQGIKKHKFGLTHTRAVPSLLHRLVRKKADKTRGIRRDPEVIYSRKMVFTREEQNSPHLKASCRQPCVPTANPTTNYYPKTLLLVIFSCQEKTDHTVSGKTLSCNRHFFHYNMKGMALRCQRCYSFLVISLWDDTVKTSRSQEAVKGNNSLDWH